MTKSNASATRSRDVTSTVSGERVRAFVPAPLPQRGCALLVNRCAMVAKPERSRQTPPSRFLTTPTSISSYFVLFHSLEQFRSIWSI